MVFVRVFGIVLESGMSRLPNYLRNHTPGSGALCKDAFWLSRGLTTRLQADGKALFAPHGVGGFSFRSSRISWAVFSTQSET